MADAQSLAPAALSDMQVKDVAPKTTFRPLGLEQEARTAQRRLIATALWHLGNNKSLELLDISKLLHRSITGRMSVR